MDTLYIVMPAYNESETIRTVISEWYPVVERHNRKEKARMVIVDDGSTDNTYEILLEEAQKRPLLIPLTKENGGHGDAVLYGYRYAVSDRGGAADYIFQTDSDGQTRPDEFEAFWRIRKENDAVIGHRNHRQDGVSRIFVTKMLQCVVYICFGQWVTDANTPFRLMSREKLIQYMQYIPKHFNLPNVALAAAYVRFSKGRVTFLPITFRRRQGGVNSINLKKIAVIGVQAIKDFRHIRRKMDDFER